MPGPSVSCEDSFLLQLLRGWNGSCWKAGCISPCPDESLCPLAYGELYLSPSDGIKIIYTPCPLSDRPTHLTTTHLTFTYLLILFFLSYRLAHPSTRYHCPWITVDPYLDHPSFYGMDFPSSLLNFRATSKSGYEASPLAVPAHGVSHSTNLAFLFFLFYLNTGISVTPFVCDEGEPVKTRHLGHLLLQFIYAFQIHWVSASNIPFPLRTGMLLHKGQVIPMWWWEIQILWVYFFKLLLKLLFLIILILEVLKVWISGLWFLPALIHDAFFPCGFCDLGLWAMHFPWNFIWVN